MSRYRNAALVPLFLLLLACLAGCTGAPAPSREVPGWVRVVPHEREGRSLFVGGVSLAMDREAGIAAAEADGRSQIHLHATRECTELFTLGHKMSGVETTARERLDYKSSIAATYGDRMAEAARQDSVFFQPCGDAPRPAQREGTDSGGPICQVFVLLSVEAASWDRELGEILAVEKRRRAEHGEKNLAELAEWMIRQILEEEPEVARERSR